MQQNKNEKRLYQNSLHAWGFPGGSVKKNLPANAGDSGSIPWLGRCPGEGNGNPLPYSCLENSMDGGAWWKLFNATKYSVETRFLLLLLLFS